MIVPPLSIRRIGAAFAAGTVLVGGLLASPAAAAAGPAPELGGEAALALADRLGDRSAGAYRDEVTGDLVVTVTDETAARVVRAAGGVARTVDGVANAGTTVASSFPGNDYGMVRWDNPNANRPGAVNMYNGSTRDISRAGNPYVGQAVGASGSTTGLTRGSVNAVNVTANYSAGAVNGLFRTNLCTAGGDSGGAVFAHNTALGLHSGGVVGACISFHQPVTEVLAAYNARVY